MRLLRDGGLVCYPTDTVYGIVAAAELVGDELHAVADAEHGEAGVEDVGGRQGRAFVVDGGGAAGEDDASGREFTDELIGYVVGVKLAIDVGFPHPASDQLGILRAEIEDEDSLMHVRGWPLFHVIIRRFFGDLHVMHVGFPNTSGGDLNKLGFAVHFINCATAEITHA